LNSEKLHIRRIQNLLLDWIKTNYDNYPWREEQDPIYAIIAEVMLQKTRADNVLPVFLNFKVKFPNLGIIQQTPEEELLKVLYPLGLQKRNINLIHLLKNLEGDNIPCTKKELIKLRGVGEYTANAYLSLHREIKEPIIDTNAIRLWSRIFNKQWNSTDYKSKDFLEFAKNITPDNDFKNFNYAVLDLARKICKPKPICLKCPVNTICEYSKGNNSK